MASIAQHGTPVTTSTSQTEHTITSRTYAADKVYLALVAFDAPAVTLGLSGVLTWTPLGITPRSETNACVAAFVGVGSGTGTALVTFSGAVQGVSIHIFEITDPSALSADAIAVVVPAELWDDAALAIPTDPPWEAGSIGFTSAISGGGAGTATPDANGTELTDTSIGGTLIHASQWVAAQQATITTTFSGSNPKAGLFLEIRQAAADSSEPPPDSSEPPPDSSEPPPDSSEPPPDSSEPPPDSSTPAPPRPFELRLRRRGT